MVDKAKECADMGQFVFLDDSEYNIPGENITVFGATLFTDPPVDKLETLESFYNNDVFLYGWDVQQHVWANHQTWRYLSERIRTITVEDPSRAFIIFTHNCPSRSVLTLGDTLQADVDGVSHRFSTDSEGQHPWGAPNLLLWAFGSTNHNCDYADMWSDMRVYSNQRGFQELEDFDERKFVDVVPLE
ncbi:hypothetical protein F4677DRAFT_331651 [Hypoxylon crocopeplum]|nr:hypothetical protein F4677DRAFT_331651 [Hypoxylon crocopeplum]